MINTTFFGEISKLDSRAVWYSDEEDDSDSLDGDFEPELPQQLNRSKTIEPATSEATRAKVSLDYHKVANYPEQFENCIISQSSQSHFKNSKPQSTPNVTLIGTYDSFDGTWGRALACHETVSVPAVGGQQENSRCTLWLWFNSAHERVCGQEVAYLVEVLRNQLYNEFKLNHSVPIVVLSQQYSSGETLEYLTNIPERATELTFRALPLPPPRLIKNQFESAIFEQLTLTIEPAVVVCLPDPRDFWFDKSSHWPSVPSVIIESKQNDHDLEKTLIFT